MNLIVKKEISSCFIIISTSGNYSQILNCELHFSLFTIQALTHSPLTPIVPMATTIPTMPISIPMYVAKSVIFHHRCNAKFTCREPNQAVATGTFNSKDAIEKSRTGFPVECTPCYVFFLYNSLTQ